MFFKLPMLTLNNVVWVNFSTVLFDETQHVVKTSTVGYVLVCYEVINLFIEPQNFLLMFLICKLKGVYLIVAACDGFLMLFLYSFYTLLVSHFTKATAHSNFNCTIQINEDIMRIYFLSKGAVQSGTLYFRLRVSMALWKVLEIMSYIPYA